MTRQEKLEQRRRERDERLSLLLQRRQAEYERRMTELSQGGSDPKGTERLEKAMRRRRRV